MRSIFRPTLAVAAMVAGGAAAAPVIGSHGLSAPAQSIGFEGARADPGALVLGLNRAGVGFSGPLALSPQAVDHVSGMSGASLGNQGVSGWRGEVSITFDDVMNAAAFAFATERATTHVAALLDGWVVEAFTLETNWYVSDTAYLGFRGIRFDEIRLRTDAALVLIDNLQLGETDLIPQQAAASLMLTRNVVAPVPVPAAFGLLAAAFAALGVFRLRRRP
ncbi:MAG: hypothetical protein ACJAVR_000008 [Paracoccaceae bacterium]|jgi:hypothetical protein